MMLQTKKPFLGEGEALWPHSRVETLRRGDERKGKRSKGEMKRGKENKGRREKVEGKRGKLGKENDRTRKDRRRKD